MQGYKPFGMALCESEPIVLQLEEYEAFKLVGYENKSQDEAALQMNVSRPTLTRVYNSALKKIARAFVEGKSILIEGGNYELDKEWYRCKNCYRLIEGLENHFKCEDCNRFGPDELISLGK
jgi:predicted DNA-binding protein (UPF0251 family)